MDQPREVRILVFVIIACILLLVWYFICPAIDYFTPLKTNINVEIDIDGYPLEYSTKTPHENGKVNYKKVDCPKLYDDAMVCWSNSSILS